MKTNYHIILLILATTLLTSTSSKAIEVRQEPYLFRMAMTRDVISNTFVICGEQIMKNPPTINAQIPLVHFELDSAALLPATEATILSSLKQAGISPKTPLSVTGYTCTLGTESRNSELSFERATAVADFLNKQGFTAATVTGKGASSPIIMNPPEFYKNRRVEITTHP